jgi:hypothetical protein
MSKVKRVIRRKLITYVKKQQLNAKTTLLLQQFVTHKNFTLVLQVDIHSNGGLSFARLPIGRSGFEYLSRLLYLSTGSKSDIPC